MHAIGRSCAHTRYFRCSPNAIEGPLSNLQPLELEQVRRTEQEPLVGSIPATTGICLSKGAFAPASILAIIT